jgi:hypothetical protein
MQKMKLSTKYGADEEFSIEVKCMMALSFLEKEEIPVYFAELYLELSPYAHNAQ